MNNGGAGIQEAGATDAADIANRLASMVGLSSYLVDCTTSGNVITVSLEPGVNGPVEVSTNSGSAPATLSRSVPGIYTAQVASSAEIRVGATSASTSAAPTTRSSRSWPLVPARSRRISTSRTTGASTTSSAASCLAPGTSGGL